MENRWIPVSEKLPPKPKPNELFGGLCVDVYLTTFKVKGGFLVATALWNGKVFSDHTFMDNGATAWMTLPEPYKEE